MGFRDGTEMKRLPPNYTRTPTTTRSLGSALVNLLHPPLLASGPTDANISGISGAHDYHHADLCLQGVCPG